MALCLAALAPAEDRILRVEAVVHAPAKDLWAAFQTGEGIQKLWGVAKAEVDFKPGGSIRTTYDANIDVKSDAAIVNDIVTFEPERVLVLKSHAPANAPDFIKAICETGWTVLRLEPLTPTSTRVIVTGMGYKDGPVYDQAYEFFREGNGFTLEKMKKGFDAPEREKTAAAIADRFRSMVGDWEFAQPRPDGGTFRGKTTFRSLFDGRVYFAAGFLGDDKKMLQHSHFTAAVDPRSGEWIVWNFDQDGSYTVAPISISGDTMTLDWNTWNSEGVLVPYQVKYIFQPDGAFDTHVLASPNPDGTRNTIAKVHYVRSKDAGTPLPPQK